MRRLLSLLMLLCFCLPLPVLAQQNTSFPFNEVQQLTPEQIKIQKYKLERLRIAQIRGEWNVIRGVNEKVTDTELLKLLGKTDQLKDVHFNQTMGNAVALTGLALVTGGGLLMSNIISFDNSILIGIGAIIAGGAMALGGEIWAGNVGDVNDHILDRHEAEQYIEEYNQQLKKELGVENIPNLE